MIEKLNELKTKSIYLGTSSWKYDGWTGLIYKKPYSSEKAFKDNCLSEYADVFTTVGVDHTYYAWPSPATFEKYLKQTPDHFKLALKVTEKITVFKYPNLKRYGKYAGKQNPDFLNPTLFLDSFLAPLGDSLPKIGVLMLEFSQFYPGMISSGGEFTRQLSHFLSEIRKAEQSIPLAVELRNENWLKPPYFKALCDNNTAHVFNSWTRMPSIGNQLELTKEFKFPFYPSRVLLKPGRSYQKAVSAFSPYNKIQEELPVVRKDAAHLIERAIRENSPAYVLVNNRAEGCAPKTIEGIIEKLP